MKVRPSSVTDGQTDRNSAVSNTPMGQFAYRTFHLLGSSSTI